ncbi:MAG: AraC family transcriptional regulator [Clostridiaceae bacterium]|nr:AraC family transcriptional regulator [Clostridiaceae bacterium]
MKIKTIDIQYFRTSSLNMSCDGLKHVKSLPFLSIVQATRGFYEIGIGSAPPTTLKEMGTFIAPAYQMQHITHHTDPASGNMTAHWIFLDVVVNHQYRLDEIFRFPLVLPVEYESTLCTIIDTVTTQDSLCLKLAEIYRLIQILIDIGTPQEAEDDRNRLISSYVKQHLAERLSPAVLARELNVSIPTLFRIFRQNFDMTPANYVNNMRLMQAVGLLDTTDKSITEISKLAGFYDQPLFSRLFKHKYGVSPSEYRHDFRR